MAIQNSPVVYDSMDTSAFKKHINQMKILGQTAVKEKIALNMRYAAVFSHILVMMIGIPFTMEIGGKLNKVLNFALALIATFIYWGSQATTKSLGENFVLTPLMAAWMPNFIFALIGIYFLVKARK